MKRLLLLFIAMLVVGCKNFETQKFSSEQIVKQELARMDWDELDTYPSFGECDGLPTKAERKQCFEQQFSRHIFKVLSQHQVELKDSIHQQLVLTIAISAEGIPSLDKLTIPQEVKAQIPEIRTWIEQAISNLPKIYPAEKRGVPVASKFKLPLIIQSQ